MDKIEKIFRPFAVLKLKSIPDSDKLIEVDYVDTDALVKEIKIWHKEEMTRVLDGLMLPNPCSHLLYEKECDSCNAKWSKKTFNQRIQEAKNKLRERVGE